MARFNEFDKFDYWCLLYHFQICWLSKKGRYRLEFAKLSNRTRNKLLKFTNNVLLERSHTIEHVGINDRVKGKEYLFLQCIPL